MNPTPFIRLGAKVRIRAAKLPGIWSVWAQAPSDRPGTCQRWWLIPHDATATGHTNGGDPYRDIAEYDLLPA